MSNSNISGRYLNNLGEIGLHGTYGTDVSTVDSMFRNSYQESTPICTACGATAVCRLVAKRSSDNTAEIERGVYFCNPCITKSTISREVYGIAKLQG